MYFYITLHHYITYIVHYYNSWWYTSWAAHIFSQDVSFMEWDQIIDANNHRICDYVEESCHVWSTIGAERKTVQKTRKSQNGHEKLHPGTLSGSSLMSFTCTGSFPKTPIFAPVILRTASWAISEEA